MDDVTHNLVLWLIRTLFMALQRIRTLFMALQRIRTLFMALQRIRTLLIWPCRGSEHCCFPTVLCCSDANGDKTLVTTELFVVTNYFFATDICHDKHMFVTTKVLLQQAYFCCDKRCVLLWQTCVCCYKSKLSQQKICCNKIMFATTNVCCNKGFVATKICLLRQRFCRKKLTFVATKLLSWQNLYLWQLPPVIVRLWSVTVKCCLKRDKRPKFVVW